MWERNVSVVADDVTEEAAAGSQSLMVYMTESEIYSQSQKKPLKDISPNTFWKLWSTEELNNCNKHPHVYPLVSAVNTLP